MKETLKMMKGIITGKEQELEENELIKEYQNKLSNNILAYFFIDNFGMITLLSDSYPYLDEDDKASFCLQELDKCLRNFNIKNKVKFTTYFYTCYKNRLRMEFEQINTQKRKILYFYADSTDSYIIDDHYTKKTYEMDIDLIDDLDSVLDKYNLNEKEKKICKMLSDGYKVKDISALYELKPVSIYQKISIIRKKILKTNIKLVKKSI